ncbi:hypothetical protein F4808DRAFT_44618 [Astrocystis sublimbata]|nr:hypothetical protein F4808DRAFT_44618 [Astrocystis sublimbata]
MADNSELRIKDGQMMVSATDLRDNVFESIAFTILKLVREHVSHVTEPIQLVSLFGGFSQSPYLRSRLDEEIGNKMGISCFYPRYPEMVVSMGAALAGLANLR